MSTPKKKIVGPIEIVSLLAVIILIAYITLKSGGGKVYEKAETVEITNNPTGEGQTYQPRKRNTTQEDERVEAILQEIADQFGKENVVRESIKLDNAPTMSQDELRYLEEVRREKERSVPEGKDVDWLTVLRASHKTYSKVKSAFETAGIDVSEVEKGVGTAVINEAAERTLYSKLEEYFNIPAEDTKAFAKKGQQKISDWARFVDEKKE